MRGTIAGPTYVENVMHTRGKEYKLIQIRIIMDISEKNVPFAT